jgi:hypothetical protein
MRKKGGEKEEEYAREVLQRVLPVGSKDYLAWVEGVGEVLIEGMQAVQQAVAMEVEDEEEEEEREELEGLWGESVHLLSLAPDELRRDVFGALASRHGEREVQALQEELLLVGAASAVLSWEDGKKEEKEEEEEEEQEEKERDKTKSTRKKTRKPQKSCATTYKSTYTHTHTHARAHGKNSNPTKKCQHVKKNKEQIKRKSNE